MINLLNPWNSSCASVLQFLLLVLQLNILHLIWGSHLPVYPFIYSLAPPTFLFAFDMYVWPHDTHTTLVLVLGSWSFIDKLL